MAGFSKFDVDRFLCSASAAATPSQPHTQGAWDSYEANRLVSAMWRRILDAYDLHRDAIPHIRWSGKNAAMRQAEARRDMGQLRDAVEQYERFAMDALADYLAAKRWYEAHR